MDILKEPYLPILADITERHAPEWSLNQTAIPSIACSKNLKADSMQPMSLMLKPSLCLIAQGAKVVTFGGKQFKYNAGEFLVTLVNLPLMWIVVEGCVEKPYLCFMIELDPALLSDLLMQKNIMLDSSGDVSQALFKGRINQEFGDAITRLAGLLDRPDDAPYLAPVYIQEIYYRLITSEHCRSIISAVIPGTNTERISKAICHINRNFLSPLRMDEMAAIAGMSVSSFYDHFKAMTAASPLQYQKQLRLVEARRLIATESLDATSAAYRVGYQSPSQFNREYARMFGLPPGRDRTSMRDAVISTD